MPLINVDIVIVVTTPSNSDITSKFITSAVKVNVFFNLVEEYCYFIFIMFS
jgi:hypothetical protein